MAEKSDQPGHSRSTGSSATLSPEDQAYRNKLRRLAVTYSDAIRKYLQVHWAEKDNKNVICCRKMELMFRRPQQRYPMENILKIEQFLKGLFGNQTNTMTSAPISQQRAVTSILDKRLEGPPEKRLRLGGDKKLPVPENSRQVRADQTSVQAHSVSSNKKQQAMLGNHIAKEKVALEGGGQFEKGENYLVRSKDGQNRKMLLKNGRFIPYDPEKNKIRADQTSVQAHSVSSNKKQQAMLGNHIAKEKVALEGGGQFEEGENYLVRSKDGQNRKMLLKNGRFIPYDPEKNKKELKTAAKVPLQNSIRNTHDLNCKSGPAVLDKKTTEHLSVKPKTTADLKLRERLKVLMQNSSNSADIAKQQLSAAASTSNSKHSTPTALEDQVRKCSDFIRSLSHKRKHSEYEGSFTSDDSDCHTPEKQTKTIDSSITKLGKLIQNSVGNVKQSTYKALKLKGNGVVLKEFLGHGTKMIARSSNQQMTRMPVVYGSSQTPHSDSSRAEFKAKHFYSKDKTGQGNPPQQSQSTPREVTHTKSPPMNSIKIESANQIKSPTIQIESKTEAQRQSPTVHMKIQTESLDLMKSPTVQVKSETGTADQRRQTTGHIKIKTEQLNRIKSPTVQVKSEVDPTVQTKSSRSTLMHSKLQKIFDSDKPVTGNISGHTTNRPWTTGAADRYHRTRPVPCGTPSSSDRTKTWETKVPTRTGRLSPLQAMTLLSQTGRKEDSNKAKQSTDTPPSVSLKRQTDSSSGQIGQARRIRQNASPSLFESGSPHINGKTRTPRQTLTQHRLSNTSPDTPVTSSNQPSRMTSIDKYKHCTQMLKNRLAACSNMSSSGSALKSEASPETPRVLSGFEEFQNRLDLATRFRRKMLSERDLQLQRNKKAAIQKLSSLSGSSSKSGTSKFGSSMQSKPNIVLPHGSDSKRLLNKESSATIRSGTGVQASTYSSPSSASASVSSASTPSQRLSAASASTTSYSTPSRRLSSVGASVISSSAPSQRFSTSPSVTSPSVPSRRLSSVSASENSASAPSQLSTNPSLTSVSTLLKGLISASPSATSLCTPSQGLNSPSVTSVSTSSRRLSTACASGTSAFTPSWQSSSTSGSLTSASTSSRKSSSASLSASATSQPIPSASASTSEVSTPSQPQSSVSSSVPSTISSASAAVGKSSEAVPKSGSSDDIKATSDSDSECVVCMENPVNTVIYSCGHMCLCFECAGNVKDKQKECPICREIIKDIIKIYKS